MSEHHCRPTISLPDSFTIPSTRPWKSSRCKTKRDCFQTHWLDEKLVEVILKKIISTKPEDATKTCSHLEDVKSFIIDAHFLIFLVMIHGENGYTEEAFDYAKLHLKKRNRNIDSVWTKKFIQTEIKTYEINWKQGSA